MERDFGTVCLITNPVADFYLEKASKPKNNPPKDRLSRPCGGKGGFDDYAEWLTWYIMYKGKYNGINIQKICRFES